jgi:hypothetical protein
VARRSVEETGELGRTLVDPTVAQTRQNLEALKALTDAVDWDQMARAVDVSRRSRSTDDPRLGSVTPRSCARPAA